MELQERSDEPLISIITPTYNSAHYIRYSLESVLAQTLSDWEMLITDDGSIDETLEIVKSYATVDTRFKIFNHSKNMGPGVARNNSISHAKGRFIAFLDSDDIWEPTKLKDQIDFMVSNNSAFSFTSYRAIDESGRFLNKQHVKARKTVTMKDMLKTCYIGCSTAMYDTRMLGKVYMPVIRKRQDYGLWYKLIQKCGIAYGLDTNLTNYRIRKDSVSGSKLKVVTYQWRLYRDIFKLGYLGALRSMFYWGYYAMSGKKRKGG